MTIRHFGYHLNVLLDQGESLDLDETKKRVEDKTILDWLSEKYPDEKYNIQLEPLVNGIRKQEITDYLWRHQGLVKDRITENGLCYLMAIILS